MADYDIVNVALRRIGASAITSLSDGSNNADVASDIYAEVRDTLLRSHPWNFATKRVQLTDSGNTPAFEFDYAYSLPADWLRTISVHDNDAGYGTLLYRMEFLTDEWVIATSSSSCYMRYIYQVTDTTLMTPDFRTVFAKYLARDLSIPLTESNTLWEQIDKEAKRAMAQVRSTDAMGSFPELRPRGSWASARGGRYRDDFLND